MALIICPECGKEYSNKAVSCPNCGCPTEAVFDELMESETSALIDSGEENKVIVNEFVEEAEEEKKENPLIVFFKKNLKVIIAVCAGIVLLSAFLIYLFLSPKTVPWCCIHRTQEANCLEAKTCSRCGKEWGEALGHTWVDATCAEPQTCSVCNAVYGIALGHRWTDATCTEPKTCNVCHLTEGEPKEHEWQPATCTEPQTCSVCHLTEGDPNGHDWKAATCNLPKKCRVCKVTEGEAAGHKWKAATCTEKKKCTVCGTTEGQPLGHSVKDYVCTRCKKSVIKTSDIPDILVLTKADMKKNSVGGINIILGVTNKSKTRTIKYLTVTLEFYNAVGDLIKDDITRKTTAVGQYTGPIAPGKKAEFGSGSPVFYNSSTALYIPTRVEIEYTDGTKIVIEG